MTKKKNIGRKFLLAGKGGFNLSNKLVGEKLVNKLLNPNDPILVISDEKDKRVAFHKMLLGIFSYLRNPYHHQIDPTTEWSWAWSIVGLIDSLLLKVDNCSISED